jgi:hypothetical protein
MAKCDSPVLPGPSETGKETFGDFDLINRVEIGYSKVTVSSWRSRVTGLSVVHLDYDGERFATAVCLPSSHVHRLNDSSHREWLFCGAHREYANFASVISSLPYNTQFSMILVVRTPWNSEYMLSTRDFVPDVVSPKFGLYGLGEVPLQRDHKQICEPWFR